MNRRAWRLGAAAIALTYVGVVAAPGAPALASTTGAEVSIDIIEVDGRVDSRSPDGRWLAGVDERGAACVWSIETLAAACADGVPAPTVNSVPTMRWSPDSSAVVYGVFDYVSSIVLLTTSGEADLISGSFDDPFRVGGRASAGPIYGSSIWTPDGSSIVFTRGEFETESTTLMTVGRGGDDPTWLADLPGTALPAPVFAGAEGKLWLAISGDLDGAGGLYSVASGGQLTQLRGNAPAPADRAKAGLHTMIISGIDPEAAVARVYNLVAQFDASYSADYTMRTYWDVDLATGDAVESSWIDLSGPQPALTKPPSFAVRHDDDLGLSAPAGPQAVSLDGATVFGRFYDVDSSTFRAAFIDAASGEILATIAGDDLGLREAAGHPSFADDGSVLVPGVDGAAIVFTIDGAGT